MDSVNDFEGTRPDVPNVAAICTFPFICDIVKQALTAQDVSIASVAGGFPASQTFTEIKIAETALAVADGADEIDVVMNLGICWKKTTRNLRRNYPRLKKPAEMPNSKLSLKPEHWLRLPIYKEPPWLPCIAEQILLNIHRKRIPRSYTRSSVYHL